MAQTADFTQGPPLKPLLWFSLPLMGAAAIQLLYGTTDLIFVSRLAGPTAAAALGASNTFIACTIGVMNGISLGVTTMAANAFGAHDKARFTTVCRNTVALAAILGPLFALLLCIAAAPFLRVMDTPAEALPEAILYLRIYMLGIVFMMPYNLISGILRARGDSMTPLKLVAVGGACNVVLDAIAVWLLKGGVVGAALGTIITQGLCAFLAFRALRKIEGVTAAEIRLPALPGASKAVLAGIGAVALPAALQNVILSLSNVAIQYAINRLGTLAVAGFAIYYQVENLLWMPAVACGSAALVVVAQNLGVNQPRRAGRLTLVTAGSGVVVVGILSIVFLLIKDLILLLFTSDPGVTAAGAIIIGATVPFYCLNAVTEGFSGALKGSNHSTSSMVITFVVMCVARISLVFWLLSQNAPLSATASIYPITWTASAALLVLTSIVMYRRHLAKQACPGPDPVAAEATPAPAAADNGKPLA